MGFHISELVERKIDTEKLNRFMARFSAALIGGLQANPEKYSYNLARAPEILVRVKEALIKGSYDQNGDAMKATCKSFGVKPTRRNIEALITC